MSLQYSTVNIWWSNKSRYLFNIQLSIFNFQYSTFDIQHSIFNNQMSRHLRACFQERETVACRGWQAPEDIGQTQYNELTGFLIRQFNEKIRNKRGDQRGPNFSKDYFVGKALNNWNVTFSLSPLFSPLSGKKKKTKCLVSKRYKPSSTNSDVFIGPRCPWGPIYVSSCQSIQDVLQT